MCGKYSRDKSGEGEPSVSSGKLYFTTVQQLELIRAGYHGDAPVSRAEPLSAGKRQGRSPQGPPSDAGPGPVVMFPSNIQ